MKKSQYYILKLALFIGGIAVLIIASFLVGSVPIFKLQPAKYILACVTVIMLYIAAFLPAFLASGNGGTAVNAITWAVYCKGFALLTTVSIANFIVMFKVLTLPVGVNIAVECIAFFVFILWAFMTASAKGVMVSAQRGEDMKKAPVAALKEKARKLASLAEGLDKDDSVRKRAEKIAEDLQYLSPGNTEEQHDLERRMIGVLEGIIMDSYFYSEGELPSPSLESKLKNFDALYRERKNMV